MKTNFYSPCLRTKDYWLDYGYRIPTYISMSSATDHLVYSDFKKIIDNIILLINDTVMSDNRLGGIASDCNTLLDKIYNRWPTDNRLIVILHHLEMMIYEIIDDLEEKELYEACANVKKFQQLIGFE